MRRTSPAPRRRGGAESDGLADHDGAAVAWRAADLETFLTSMLREVTE